LSSDGGLLGGNLRRKLHSLYLLLLLELHLKIRLPFGGERLY